VAEPLYIPDVTLDGKRSSARRFVFVCPPTLVPTKAQLHGSTESLVKLVQPHAPPEAKARRTSRPWRADDAKELLTKIGAETSLRYAIHLITAASLIATRRKAAAVEIEDVSKAYQLFIDVRRSTQFLIEYQARLTCAASSAGCCLHGYERDVLMRAVYMRAALACCPLTESTPRNGCLVSFNVKCS